MRQHFFLDKLISLIYDTGSKPKRPANPITSERLALIVVGLRESSRWCRLEAFSKGFDSPRVQNMNQRPTSSGNYQWDTPSGRRRKDGVSTPAVMFALGLEESKQENDLPQLPDRMSKIRKDSQRPTTLTERRSEWKRTGTRLCRGRASFSKRSRW